MIVEKSLTTAQRDDLRVIAGMMIPESDEYKVPGADDAAIQGDIIATLAGQVPKGRTYDSAANFYSLFPPPAVVASAGDRGAGLAG